MKYFICSEDPECIPYVEAENAAEAKEKMCVLCIEASPDDFECDGPIEASQFQIAGIEKAKAEVEALLEDQCIWFSKAVRDVLDERAKQIKKHSFDADHDDKWAHSELKYAAAVYLKDDPIFNYWPWRDFPYKGKKDTERQRLITAAALIIAEIERIDRAEAIMEESE